MRIDVADINPLSYGSYLVALLALLFDVGYFSAIDVRLFTTFSISEHFLFSVQAVPIAALVIFGFIMIYYLAKKFIELNTFEKI